MPDELSKAKERLQKALAARRAKAEEAGRPIIPWDKDYINDQGIWAPRGSLVEVMAADIVTVCEATPSTDDDQMFKDIIVGAKNAIAPFGPEGPKAGPRLPVVVPFSNIEWLLEQAG